MTDATTAASLADLARAALLEVTEASAVGPLESADEVEPGVVDVRFAAQLPGYVGWRWTVSVARLPDAEPSVLELELLPGEGSLVAPPWVPWAERLAEYRRTHPEDTDVDEVLDATADLDDDEDLDDADLDDADDLEAGIEDDEVLDTDDELDGVDVDDVIEEDDLDGPDDSDDEDEDDEDQDDEDDADEDDDDLDASDEGDEDDLDGPDAEDEDEEDDEDDEDLDPDDEDLDGGPAEQRLS